jgi:purine-nucleoside phosphorylase
MLHAGRLGDRRVIAFEGRFHLYEGYDLREVTMPVRLAARLGAAELVITNVSGGLDLRLRRGDLVVIEDHLNLLPGNPLTGPNQDDWGPRFPDLSAPYDRESIRRLLAHAEEEGIRARTGVYAAVAGPNLETRAEYRMLRMLGADVVGMSTVPEVIVGVHEGLRIAAISVVTDICDPDHLEPVAVEEILQVASTAEPKLTKMVVRLLGG